MGTEEVTNPKCSGCECELTSSMEILMLRSAEGSLLFYCPACDYAMKEEAKYQKDHAERTE